MNGTISLARDVVADIAAELDRVARDVQTMAVFVAPTFDGGGAVQLAVDELVAAARSLRRDLDLEMRFLSESANDILDIFVTADQQLATAFDGGSMVAISGGLG